MKKFKNGTATVREYINITIQRIQLAGTYCTTKAINTFAQVYGIVAHYKAVVFIQVEHGFFENKGRNFPQFIVKQNWFAKKWNGTQRHKDTELYFFERTEFTE